MMVLFFIVIGSGILGADPALRPQLHDRAVPSETIYEEIPHVRAQLRLGRGRIARGNGGSGDR